MAQPSEVSSTRQRRARHATPSARRRQAAPSPTLRLAPPLSRPRLAVAAAIVVAAALTSVLLALAQAPGPLAAVALSFLAGSGAVWIVVAPDRDAARRRAAATEREAEGLRAHAERLEDKAWELRESDERHRSVVDALGDVIFRRDEAGRVTYANEAFGRCFGIELSAVVGAPLPQPLLRASGAEEGSTDDALPGPADLRLDTVAGKRWFSRLDVPVRDGATGRALVQTILRDVTPRHEAEDALVEARDQAQSASRAKSRFLATVSHEIRTPLNGILGMTRLLRDTQLSPEQASYTDAIHTSGEALLTLIEEVLDFSKIEAGKLELAPEPTNLETLVEGVVELLAPRAQAKGLEIAAYVAPDVPADVQLDGPRLRQVLINLAGNGIKFTHAGGVLIEVEAKRLGARRCRLDVAVHDTGIGIAPEAAERLFDEFEQVDHGPARRYGGTGLGLAISQRIVTRMNGRIDVASKPGQGSTFSFALEVAHGGEIGGECPGTREALAGRPIALVAGDGIEAALVARRLKDLDMRVSALDPRGLDLAAAPLAGAQGVIVDRSALDDPAAWLAGLRHSGNRAPALVLVTPAERSELPALRAAGFAAYLIKPVRSRSLLRITAALIKGEEVGDGPDSWAAAEEAGAPGGAGSGRGGATTASRPMRLLVAEDNEINLRLTVALLEKLGHEVSVVRDGQAALEAVMDCRRTGAILFDAVFTDLNMPQLDGLELIRRIRADEAEKDLPALPLFALTADAMPKSRSDVARAGASGFLTKPLDPDALAAALATLPPREPAR